MDKKNQSADLAFADQKIVGINMEHEVKKSFIEYSMSVIVSRALPDVRDGMKPGQRRIMYAMYEDHLTYDKPFRKSATTVGNVLGRYHPHGDSAVYGSMVRMAQPFSLRYPLIEGHGYFGNVDGVGAAAYRYTEARMSKLANEMMADIEKDVVDFVPNFDNKLKEPTVLPSRFPNILVNGSVGIAVGMATNIPTHNLREVIDGTIFLIDNPDAETKDIMQYIKGPDFPTRGIIYGSAGIYKAYCTGKGKVSVRARCEVDEDKHRIVVTEIPYMVNKSMLVESIANLHKEKRVEGITALRDESGRAGMRIVIEYRRDANGQVILNQLYKYTQLQDTCAINMVALVNGEPKVLPLKTILEEYIKFQMSVVRRRTEFELNRALREMHIYEGYKIAIDHIDEVIAIIKASASIPAAKQALMDRFALSDAQAQAIVEMTLGKLSGMEREKIEERLAKLQALVAELQGILADQTKIQGIVKDELTAIRDKFGDERRTELVEAEDEIVLEDLIERHRCVITLTGGGYIKRLPADTYNAQRRGGRGIKGMTTKEDDYVENVISSSSHDYLMMFTNLGKVYTRKAYLIPESSRTAKGTNIVNILELEAGEKITAIIPIDTFDESELLTMITKQGVIKRTSVSEYIYQRKNGKRAISLDEGDELFAVLRTDGERDIIIATRDGFATRFEEGNVRSMGRTARGVKGITLGEGDEVCGVVVVEEGKQLLTITEYGSGKRTEFDDFRCMVHRGGKGVGAHKITEETGRIASIAAVSDSDDVMLITNNGIIIRVHADSISTYSRTAKGVRMMRLDEGASIVRFTCVVREEEEVGVDIDETALVEDEASAAEASRAHAAESEQNSQQ